MNETHRLFEIVNHPFDDCKVYVTALGEITPKNLAKQFDKEYVTYTFTDQTVRNRYARFILVPNKEESMFLLKYSDLFMRYDASKVHIHYDKSLDRYFYTTYDKVKWYLKEIL